MNRNDCNGIKNATVSGWKNTNLKLNAGYRSLSKVFVINVSQTAQWVLFAYETWEGRERVIVGFNNVGT